MFGLFVLRAGNMLLHSCCCTALRYATLPCAARHGTPYAHVCTPRCAPEHVSSRAATTSNRAFQRNGSAMGGQVQMYSTYMHCLPSIAVPYCTYNALSKG